MSLSLMAVGAAVVVVLGVAGSPAKAAPERPKEARLKNVIAILFIVCNPLCG
jgi:hypothetical protein